MGPPGPVGAQGHRPDIAVHLSANSVVVGPIAVPPAVWGVPGERGPYLSSLGTSGEGRFEATALDLHRQVFENNRAMQLLIEPGSFRIVEANPAACRFYGYSREELVSRTLRELTAGAAEAVTDALAGADDGATVVTTVPQRLASGELRQVEMHSGPVEV